MINPENWLHFGSSGESPLPFLYLSVSLRHSTLRFACSLLNVGILVSSCGYFHTVPSSASSFFCYKIDYFNFLIKNLLDEGKPFIIGDFFKASVSKSAAKQFSSSTRRRASSSSSSGVQFLPLLFFTFDIF